MVDTSNMSLRGKELIKKYKDRKKGKKKKISKWWFVLLAMMAAFLGHVYYIEKVEIPQDYPMSEAEFQWQTEKNYQRDYSTLISQEISKLMKEENVLHERAGMEPPVSDTKIESETSALEITQEETDTLVLPVSRSVLGDIAEKALKGKLTEAVVIATGKGLTGTSIRDGIKKQTGADEDAVIEKFESSLRRALAGRPPIKDVQKEVNYLMSDSRVVEMGYALALDSFGMRKLLEEYLRLSHLPANRPVRQRQLGTSNTGNRTPYQRRRLEPRTVIPKPTETRDIN